MSDGTSRSLAPAMRQTTQSMSKLPSALLMAPSKRFAFTASAVSSAPIAPRTALIAPSKRWMCTPAYVFKGSGVTFYREMFSASSKCRRLCTKNRVEMEVFPLRSSAYLCVLCVNGPLNAEDRRDTQRTAEKTNQICHFFSSIPAR